ncbi:MAG: 3D domain-containing protein [Deltaproteobacteria bacterium]|nr:3D domain-containing protein [Deltaproteobacteria bacterium]
MAGTMQNKRFCVFAILLCFCICCSIVSCAWFRHLGKEKKTIRMEVTAYCACQKCCGWERKWGCCLMPAVYAYGPSKGKRKKVGIASDGTKARRGTIAADAKLFRFGTEMYIPGYGWGVVHDRGGAIKGYHIDIFFSDHDDAMEWGRKRLDVVVIK